MSKRKESNFDKNRRRFLKDGTLATAGFMIVPRHVIGGPGYQAPSDTLNLAAIGAGGKGFSDIRNASNKGKNNVVALCDVDVSMAARALKMFPKAKQYNDFRKMLESENMDGVTISTPDHVHGVAAMAAMELGKHVYVQKPLTHNIQEARKLTEAARKYKIVSQMGNQGASNPGMFQMIEWFGSGIIGAVSEVYSWTDRPVWPQGIPVPTNTPPLPKQMSAQDWDLFIGPAKYTEYHPLYHPFKWRGWWNFGTGALGDMGCHLIDPPYRVLGLGYPTEVECSVGQIFIEDWNPAYIPDGCPPSSHVQIKFNATDKNASPVTLTWYDGGIRPFHPDIIPAGESLGSEDSTNGVIMMGSKGIMTCDVYGANPKIFLPDGTKLVQPKKYDTGRKNQKLPEFGHHTDWTEAVKAGFGSKEHLALTSSFDYAGPLTETVLMGNLAIRSYQNGKKGGSEERDFKGRKRLLWDGENMKITNHEAANQFVGRTYREGWAL